MVVRDIVRIELRVGIKRSDPVPREPVHPSVVEVGRPAGQVVPDVSGKPLRAIDERHLTPPAHPNGSSIRAREPTEQVVEASILEHEVHDALDRPPRVDGTRHVPECRARGGRRGNSLAEARGQEESRRTCRGACHERASREPFGEHGSRSISGRIGDTSGKLAGRPRQASVRSEASRATMSSLRPMSPRTPPPRPRALPSRRSH